MRDYFALNGGDAAGGYESDDTLSAAGSTIRGRIPAGRYSAPAALSECWTERQCRGPLRLHQADP
jgi:hypothetical protein